MINQAGRSDSLGQDGRPDDPIHRPAFTPA